MPACSAGREAHPYCGCQVGGPERAEVHHDALRRKPQLMSGFNHARVPHALRTRGRAGDVFRARVLGVSARQGGHQDPTPRRARELREVARPWRRRADCCR